MSGLSCGISEKQWQPTPVLLPGESQGWGSPVGCFLWGRRVGHDWSDLAAAAAVVTYRIFGCGMWDLVPWSGLEPRPLALGAWCLSHWTSGEVPRFYFWVEVCLTWSCLYFLTCSWFTSITCGGSLLFWGRPLSQSCGGRTWMGYRALGQNFLGVRTQEVSSA